MVKERNTFSGEEFKIFPHEKPDVKTYCGPTIIMLLTGADRITVHEAINNYRSRNGEYRSRRQMVKGIYNSEMDALLKKFGMKAKRVKLKSHPSFRSFSDDFSTVKKPIVVNVTGHYVILFQGQVYDTAKRQGCPVAEHPSLSKRVKSYWIIERQKPWIPKIKIEAPKKEKPKKDIQAVRQQQALAQHEKWKRRAKQASKLEKKWASKVRYYAKVMAERGAA